MDKSVLRQQIAYRCPACAVATVGFLGGLSAVSDMLRMKCECGGSMLEIKKESEGKIRLETPCIYCKTNHAFVVSTNVVTRSETTRLSCPYSGQDILFLADGEAMGAELERSGKELASILASFEADEVGDIQPKELDDADFEPDAGIYDVLNFLVRDLESSGDIKCPCKKGPYTLRFCDEGAEVVCDSCGAAYIFHVTSQATAEGYLGKDELILS